MYAVYTYLCLDLQVEINPAETDFRHERQTIHPQAPFCKALV